ncbi:hypothetical protein ZWY2020_045116 [Hordeum vulgare]|nr:hypothetical protein ZWY2020_045116 [Hordeum vulgare]
MPAPISRAAFTWVGACVALPSPLRPSASCDRRHAPIPGQAGTHSPGRPAGGLWSHRAGLGASDRVPRSLMVACTPTLLYYRGPGASMPCRPAGRPDWRYRRVARRVAVRGRGVFPWLYPPLHAGLVQLYMEPFQNGNYQPAWTCASVAGVIHHTVIAVLSILGSVAIAYAVMQCVESGLPTININTIPVPAVAAEPGSTTLYTVVPDSQIRDATVERFLKEIAGEKPIRFTPRQLSGFTNSYSSRLGAV